MTKQIENYPELDKWCNENSETVDGGTWVADMYPSECVENKLLEQQAKINSLTEDKSKLIEVTRSVDFKELTALRSENKRLTEQNKELEDTVTRLNNLLNLYAKT